MVLWLAYQISNPSENLEKFSHFESRLRQNKYKIVVLMTKATPKTVLHRNRETLFKKHKRLHNTNERLQLIVFLLDNTNKYFHI